MKISREEVLHIAELSRLEFGEKELRQMGEHLESVLSHFEMLDSVNTDAVSPTAHILSAVNVLREDEAKEPMSRNELLKNAPETDGSAYIVPKVLE